MCVWWTQKMLGMNSGRQAPKIKLLNLLLLSKLLGLPGHYNSGNRPLVCGECVNVDSSCTWCILQNLGPRHCQWGMVCSRTYRTFFIRHLAFDNFLASWHIFCSILRHLETSFPDPLRKRQRFYSLSDLLSTKSTRRQASLPLLLEGLGQSLLRDRTPSVQAGNLSDENSRGDVMGTLCQDGSGAAVQW